MMAEDCTHYHGLLALRVVGQLADEDAVGLSAHLDGCAACRQEAADLRALSTVLPAADPDHLGGYEMPVELERAVLVGLGAEARRDARNRRLRYTLGGAIAAGIVALALVITTVLPSGPGQTVALTGTPGVHASVQLTSESWGTALHFQESGQAGGQVLWVSMRTTSGTWWTAGTYRTVTGKDVRVDMACALRLADIETVWVKTSSGRAVLRGYVS